MGNLFRALLKLYGFRDKILLLGLKAAGKTTILQKLKLGEVVGMPTIPTDLETVEYKNITFTAVDVGERDKDMRQYYQNPRPKLIIFVIDSKDRVRLPEVKNELDRMFNEEELKGIPFLFFMNKQDLPNAMNAKEISDELGLATIKNRKFHFQECCAASGDGLYEGLEWVASVLKL